MAGNGLDWWQRPIAHRGFHDVARGIIENSPSAIRAAIAKNYAVEVDLHDWPSVLLRRDDDGWQRSAVPPSP